MSCTIDQFHNGTGALWDLWITSICQSWATHDPVLTSQRSHSIFKHIWSLEETFFMEVPQSGASLWQYMLYHFVRAGYVCIFLDELWTIKTPAPNLSIKISNLFIPTYRHCNKYFCHLHWYSVTKHVHRYSVQLWHSTADVIWVFFLFF